jgi:3-oxoacyl-[acyl-carrier protein] reductase
VAPPEGIGAPAGRLALVTGAASGLAAGVALALARDGYRIAFTYLPAGTPPDATRAKLGPLDAGVLAVGNGLENYAAGAQLVAEVEATRGPIDVVVHAVGPIVVKPFARSSADDFRAMIDGNIGSAVALAAAVLPGMRTRGIGRLVFFGMNGSHVTQPAENMTLYGAAKAAVVTFARTLALEEARYGISVNVIEPGDIRNKQVTRAEARTIEAQNPTGHSGSWEDIAAAVRLVVGVDAGYLNGMVLSVNGGLVTSHE